MFRKALAGLLALCLLLAQTTAAGAQFRHAAATQGFATMTRRLQQRMPAYVCPYSGSDVTTEQLAGLKAACGGLAHASLH